MDCFFFKQKTAYEMRISDWSSDVCSSDLSLCKSFNNKHAGKPALVAPSRAGHLCGHVKGIPLLAHRVAWAIHYGEWPNGQIDHINGDPSDNRIAKRSEEHTYELQSLMRISYAVFFLNKKNTTIRKTHAAV